MAYTPLAPWTNDAPPYLDATNLGYIEAGIQAAALKADDAYTLASGVASGLSGWVDVSKAPYNATGNGSADDTGPIKQAILDAGPFGTVYFPKKSAYYRVTAYLKPLYGQTWIGQQSPRYAWDGSVTGGSIIRAGSSFSGSAVIYNDNTTTNGLTSGGNPVIGISKGVSLIGLGIFGNGEAGETGSVNGVDYGPTSGGERSWWMDRCQVMYCGTGLAGHMWVTQTSRSLISRCGYGIAPHRGAASASRMLDSTVAGNYVYFTLHHGVELGGSGEHGMVGFFQNRFERSGVEVSGSTMDPNSNRDTAACGLYISRGTSIQIMGNTTDANAGPGLRVAAATDGAVNNLTSLGNTWKRDGTGNNSSSMTPGVALKGANYVQMFDRVTWGDPNDGGAGRIAPQYGIEVDSCFWVQGLVQIDLEDAAIRNNGVRWLETTRNNWMCSLNDVRQPVGQFPYATTTNAPLNPDVGSFYWDTSLNALRVYTGSAWQSIT